MSFAQSAKKRLRDKLPGAAGREKVKSAKVDAFFKATGMVPGTPKEQFRSRVAATTTAIETDIAVLDLVPGMQTQAGQARTRLKAAAALRDKGDWQASHQALAALQTNLHGQVAAQRTLMVEGLETGGKDQKTYETAHQKLLVLAADLAVIPGASAAAAAASWAVTQADTRSRSGDLAGALTFLTRGVATAEAAKTEWSKAQRSALDAFKPVAKALAAVKTKIDAGKLDLQAEVSAKLLAEHARLMDRMVSDRPDAKAEIPAVQAKLLAAVAVLDGEVDTLVTPAVRARNTAESQLRAIETALTKAADGQPLSEAAAAQKDVIAIRSYIAERDFATAAKLSEALAKTLVLWKPLPADPEARFKIVQAQFKGPADVELARAERLKALAASIPVLTTPPAAEATVELLANQIAAYGTPENFALSNGLEVLKQAKAANDRNEERKAAYEALQGARSKAEAALKLVTDRVAAALAALKQTVASGGEAPPLPSFATPLQEAAAAWRLCCNTALTVEDLRLAEFTARFEALEKQIAAVAANPASLAGKKREGEYAALAERFETARTTTEGAVTTLLDADFAAGDAQRSAMLAASARFLAAVKALDPVTAKAEIAKLEAVGTAAAAAKAAAATKIGEMRLAFNVARDSIGGDLTRLQNTTDKAHAAQVAKLVATLGDISAIGSSGDASVLAEAVDQFYALRGDVNAMLGLFDPSKRIANAVTVDTLAARATALGATFRDANVTRLEPVALAALQARLDAAVAQIGDVRLAQSTAALDGVAADWTALKATAAQHAVEQKAFLEQVKTAGEMLGSGRVLPNCPEYEAALKMRLKALQTLSEGGKTDRKAYDAIMAEIAEARLHPDAAQRGQEQAETDALKAVVTAKRWEADYTAFKGKLQALERVLDTLDGVAKNNFAEQLEALRTKAAAIDHDKKVTPYETMAGELQRLVGNADTMIKYPMGQATHARGELLAVDKRWNDAAAGFRTQLDALAKAVAAATGTGREQEAAIAAIDGRVAEVKRLVTPGMITPMIQAVIAAKHDITAARDAREAALREVSRMSRVVGSHPLLAQVSGNPFQVDLTRPIANLRAALFDLETNLLISL